MILKIDRRTFWMTNNPVILKMNAYNININNWYIWTEDWNFKFKFIELLTNYLPIIYCNSFNSVDITKYKFKFG